MSKETTPYQVEKTEEAEINSDADLWQTSIKYVSNELTECLKTLEKRADHEDYRIALHAVNVLEGRLSNALTVLHMLQDIHKESEKLSNIVSKK